MVPRDVARRQVRVRGIVQGVGFRPTVYRLATRLQLTGFVLNDSSGVVIEIEGAPATIDAFRTALTDEAPALAVIEAVEESEVSPTGSTRFEIRRSEDSGSSRTPISPDIATCDACMEEIRDPTDRRYGYAFTNCTNCGPRFTITTSVPYDRPNTTMAAFEMCDACRKEYEDPTDRRFHAQPIACPACGPSLRLVDRGGTEIAGDPVAAAARHIKAGGIVAVKGLGGYHLACDATSEDVVRALRRRKGREEKPLAVMVPSVEEARRVAVVGGDEAGVLLSGRRPIVLLRSREHSPIASSVAPANRFLGVMLPYTPLHSLLIEAVGGPMVMTSGNLSEEPIVHTDDGARDRLSGIADCFLAHNRSIHVRCDDSVVRVFDGGAYPVRRARGFAPEPLSLRHHFARPVVGAGGELKHTFCIGVGDRAILSQHTGDVSNWESMSAFSNALEHFERVFEVLPEIVAYDLHPEYMSTKWALDLDGIETVGVQHHHAHIASCLADNGRSERVIGLALDGTGYGTDDTIWGCEVLVCDLVDFERAIHLCPLPMPGGAAAIREPWRMAAVYLDAAFGPEAPAMNLDGIAATVNRWGPVLRMAEARINSPSTSSAGRLFDAAAALCGLRQRITYEGQAAAEFEQVADPRSESVYACSVRSDQIDGVELIAALAEDLVAGRPVPDAAAAFHNGLATALVRACEIVRARNGLGIVALSGGTWQNLLLLGKVRTLLREAGFDVLTHRRVPPNDGGLSLGQAVIANARAREFDQSQ